MSQGIQLIIESFEILKTIDRTGEQVTAPTILISAALCQEVPNQTTSATVGGALRRRARPTINSFTESEFNQTRLAESWVTSSSTLVAILQNDSHFQSAVLVGSDIAEGELCRAKR